jgi:hypothetical protein
MFDGGNTNLDEEVETTLPWDIYQQFNDLLATSPYLDEAVLIEVIQNPGFTSLMVKLLMIANPHAVNSEAVMIELENRIPAMPQSYIDEIRSQPEVASQYKLLEGNVAADYHLISNIGEDIKRLYRNNQEDAWAKDSLINFVSRQPDMYDKFELATIYLSYGQYEDMENLLDNISNIYEIDEEKTAELSEFSIVIDIAKVMEQENLYESSLTDTQRSDLENIIANSNPITAPFALSILKRDNPEYVFEETVFDVEENSARMAKPSTMMTEPVEGGEFKIYPNPTKDYTTLSYNCKFANMSYSILDMVGKTLLTKSLITIEDKNANEILIDLSFLSGGSYQILIKSNNTTLWSEKLLISK